MTQRSREEIESQFGRDNINKKNAPSDSQDARSVRMIGGEIKGLNTAKMINIPYLIWGSLILALLTLFVLIGEKNKQQPQKAQSPQTANKDYTKNQISSFDEPFARVTDIERANQYRESQAKFKKTNELLSQASSAFKKGIYTRPKNKSALHFYNKVLSIDPNNFQAKNGIEAINKRFFAIGIEQLTDGDVDAANETLISLQSIDSESYQVNTLIEQIEIFELERPINKLLEKAALAITKEQWVIPKEDSALFFFNQALNIDEQNTVVLDGLKQTLNNSILLANAAITNDNFEIATTYVDTISSLSPDHPSLGLLKGRITDKFTRDIEKNLSFVKANQVSDSESVELVSNTPTRSNIIYDQKTSTEELDESNLRIGLIAFDNKEYPRSLELLTPLAEKGIARARMRLALIYSLGLEVTPNRGLSEQYAQQALPAIQKFAQEGRAWAQSDLGSMNDYGLALGRDYNQALAWRQKAADQQFAEAQRDIADMYYRGRGVPQNTELAITYYRDAAANGDTQSKAALAALGVN